jgi:hypothetical protein
VAIEKSEGYTNTEKLLSCLCNETFLNLWSYANPYYKDGKIIKEFCDIIAIFENHLFIFFDREKKLELESEDKDYVKWNRWYRDVIERQINTCNGAERYISNGGILFLDNKAKIEIPIKYDLSEIKIHRFIIAHGAEEACKQFSQNNINGSLAITYDSIDKSFYSFPFFVRLDKSNPIHIFDSYNLNIVLKELDTFSDFVSYIIEKENAIKKFQTLTYCGEEDLLAHYFYNYDENSKQHYIGHKDHMNCDFLYIEEGFWKDFIKKEAYFNTKQNNKISYFWDDIINDMSKYIFNENSQERANNFSGKSAIYEMAKEPRFVRRFFSQKMIEAIENFQDLKGMRHFVSFQSYYSKTMYIYLQLKENENFSESDNRKCRIKMLEILCAVTKNKFLYLEKIIGIATEPLKYVSLCSKDFLLLECSTWTEEQKEFYDKENERLGLNFYSNANINQVNVKEFE